jgi:hypothetical protein
MSVPEKDELIINLTVLSQLNKNRKISTKECFLNIEPVEVYIPESVRRWWRGDSREETLKKLDNIIVKAVSLLKKHEELIQYLKKSLIGLENLKQTYTDCTQTNARLDVIIDKAKRGIEDYEKNLKKHVKITKKDNNKLENNDKKNYSSYSTDSDHDSENSDF